VSQRKQNQKDRRTAPNRSFDMRGVWTGARAWKKKVSIKKQIIVWREQRGKEGKKAIKSGYHLADAGLKNATKND